MKNTDKYFTVTTKPAESIVDEAVWGTASFPDTGWRCCICYEIAQIDCCGCKMCVSHAKEFNHGRGKTLDEMSRDYERSTI